MDKLMTYKIEITETLQRVVEIKAENQGDALQQVYEDYGEGKIILDAQDIVGLDISNYNI